MGKSGNVAAAKLVAAVLLTTSARSDALSLLGQIAMAEGRPEDATTTLEQARKLHRTQQKWRELARDDGMLASVYADGSDFVAALRLIDECVLKAQLAGDKHMECYCHLVAIRTLIATGYSSAARLEIEATEPLVASDVERFDLEYQRGNYEYESGNHAMAIFYFKSVLEARKRSPDILWTINTELNLAYSLAEQKQAEQKQIDQALLYLEDARLRDVDHRKEPEWTWTAAQIAYRKHDLAGATTLNERYFSLPRGGDSVDRDDQIKVATLQARIELDRKDLGAAERWARRAVELAELVRGAQGVLELRPWVLERWRAPYELLFTALARSGQIEEAAMVIDMWQGRTVQDALARPRPPASLDHDGIADQIAQLERWLPAASQSTFARSPDRESVLSTMRGIDLLALIVADGDVWSLTANHGPPRLSRLAALADIEDRVADFRGHPTGHPTDVERASALGALLLPDESFRATSDVLHVLIDGRLKGLPVAALRRGATTLIERRPIVRVLRLPETRCVHVAPPGHATVLGNPGGNLSNAQSEAVQVAGLLHTTSVTGAGATKAALFGAANDAVLHIAAHARFGIGGATIPLADGEVSALEISARRLAPSLAVLSVCDAATSEDSELAGSLAAGFLAAGSQHVVATLQSVSDAGALAVSTGFYSAGGVSDPARALQAAQAALVGTPNTDWPYFTVFGPDVCPERAALDRR
jgi:tetratricopeptide (TPR) repeat protein